MIIKIEMTKQEAFELTGCTGNLDNVWDKWAIVYPEAKNEIIARLAHELNDREMPEYEITFEIEGVEI